MFRTLLLASAVALGTVGAVQAEPRLVGGGNNAEVVYDAQPGSVVGGGTVTLSGGAENRTYTYGTVRALPGMAGELLGGGENAEVVYGPAQTATGLAGAPAAGYRG